MSKIFFGESISLDPLKGCVCPFFNPDPVSRLILRTFVSHLSHRWVLHKQRELREAAETEQHKTTGTEMERGHMYHTIILKMSESCCVWMLNSIQVRNCFREHRQAAMVTSMLWCWIRLWNDPDFHTDKFLVMFQHFTCRCWRTNVLSHHVLLLFVLSVQGALQLKQDFDSIREMIMSDKYGLSAELHQRLLGLR